MLSNCCCGCVVQKHKRVSIYWLEYHCGVIGLLLWLCWPKIIKKEYRWSVVVASLD